MEFKQFKSILQKDCQLDPDRPVLAGVSGGPDSLCLLELLVGSGITTIAAHFNHRLRPEAQQDEETVRAAAARLGAAFVTGGADVAMWAAAQHRSIEDAARFLRYRFLFDQARRFGAQAVAVGHTADDQVETVLMHILRGSGLDGLAGMAFRVLVQEWDPALPVVRPLLAFWRSQTLGYCQERGLVFAVDASNQDPAYMRNRVRLHLIPELETYNPGVRQALWRLSQAAAGEVETARQAALAAWESCFSEEHLGWLALWLRPLRELPRPLQRAVARLAAGHLLVSPAAMRELGFDEIERAVDFIHQPPRSGEMDWVQGLRLRVEPGTGDRSRLLVLAPGLGSSALPEEAWPSLAQEQQGPLAVPGQVALGGGWELSADWAAAQDRPANPGPWEAWLDGEQTAQGLSLRLPLPGDRFKPLGLQGRSQKLSDFWINEKLPRRARKSWPLVCCGEEIAWVPGFRQGETFKVRGQTQTALHLVLRRSPEKN